VFRARAFLSELRVSKGEEKHVSFVELAGTPALHGPRMLYDEINSHVVCPNSKVRLHERRII
jgi:hypothetical protein